MPRPWNPNPAPARLSQRRVAAAVVLAFGLVVAACGGGGGSSSSSTKTAVDGKIDVNAFDPFRFDVKTIKASPGPLTVTLHEKGGSEHTFTISSKKFELIVTPAHSVATGTVTLAAGTYQFKCSYDGHAAAGMVGTVVVG